MGIRAPDARSTQKNQGEHMQIGVPKEAVPGELRVAITPEVAKKLVRQGHSVKIESGAGRHAAADDADYLEVGCALTDAADAMSAQVVLKVQAPLESELVQMRSGATLIGMLNPHDRAGLDRLAKAGVTSFALEAIPRTTRSQSMDVLSSQASIAGYKAVLVGASAYKRFMPMLMTAAGTVKAARVVILGCGVAGLQAIATAKRMGAVIEASDVRPSVKEQVESLGAKFIDVPYETDEERTAAEGVGGYARPMPPSWLERQRQLVATRVASADIVITTALVPGRPAPELVSADMVESMRPGSVIVDLAAGRGPDGGGNCPLTEAGQVVIKHGVTIVGETNLPSHVAADASALYARNVWSFLDLLTNDEGGLVINLEDDIVSACLMTKDGRLHRQ